MVRLLITLNWIGKEKLDNYRMISPSSEFSACYPLRHPYRQAHKSVTEALLLRAQTWRLRESVWKTAAVASLAGYRATCLKPFPLEIEAGAGLKPFPFQNEKAQLQTAVALVFFPLQALYEKASLQIAVGSELFLLEAVQQKTWLEPEAGPELFHRLWALPLWPNEVRHLAWPGSLGKQVKSYWFSCFSTELFGFMV